jgi:hypothetical protein
MSSTILLIQGPVDYKTELVKYYNQFPNVIWTTWKGNEINNKNIDLGTIQMNYIDMPNIKGHTNINLQCLSTTQPIKQIQEDEKKRENKKEKKIKYGFKIRSDIMITDIDILLKYLEYVYVPGILYILSPQNNTQYSLMPTDYIMFGALDDLYKFWNYHENSTIKFPTELKLTRQYFNLSTEYNNKIEITKEQFKEKFNFFLNYINQDSNNIEIFWLSKWEHRFVHTTKYTKNVFINKYITDSYYHNF